jgi:glycosyltransferase involved in cell wall biosynthesis
MKVVMATKFVPWPANSGGRQRSLALVTRLRELGEVTLCAYDDGSSDAGPLEDLGIEVRAVPWARPPHRTALGCVRSRSITAGRFDTAEMRRTVSDAARDADALVVSYSALSYLLTVPTPARTALDLHNVETSLLESYRRSRRGPMAAALRLEVVATRALERRALRRADVVSVVSEVDRARAADLGRPDVLVCPNGWEVRPELPAATEPVAVFVGLLGWRPNVEAATWLAEQVWPSVRAAVPGARLLLVGRDPAPAVRALAAEDVEVTGTVPAVDPYLAKARVALAPLQAGGGSRLKILEALGAGRPVVATRIGAEGLGDLEGSGLLIADEPAAFARVVVDLLTAPARAAELGQQGRRAVSERYGWDRTLAPLLEALA